MENYFSQYVATMDGHALYVRIGWCPDVVKITKISDGQDNLWCRMMGNDAALARAVAGDRTATTDRGIKLVKFTDEPINLTSAPTEIDPTEWYKANGIMITDDVGFLADDDIVLVQAWRMTSLFLKAVHDGGNNCNTYFEDSSYDFKECGVSGGCKFIIYNKSNGNYAYIKDVVKPQGSNKYCRLETAIDVNGTPTSNADFDDDDEVYIFSVSNAWYPMSDIELMG